MTVRDQLIARVRAMDEDQAAHVLRILDDEPLSSDDEIAITEGLEDLTAGRILTPAEVRDLFV